MFVSGKGNISGRVELLRTQCRRMGAPRIDVVLNQHNQRYTREEESLNGRGCWTGTFSRWEGKLTVSLVIGQEVQYGVWHYLPTRSCPP